MRIAFTIVFNGKHHLHHNDFAKRMAKMFDLWVIVEGPAKPGGSTSWCKGIPGSYLTKYHSADGTLGELLLLQEQYKNIRVVQVERFWESKDEMVNAAIDEILKTTRAGWLWQVDVDEQWEEDALASAERHLDYLEGTCGEFLCDYYVGRHIRAKGEWGEGIKCPYRRLWKWAGQHFLTHEPPQLSTQRERRVLLPQIFMHYAYYFPQDVLFKGSYYSGHEGLFDRWLALQRAETWPQPVSCLITGSWGRTNTIFVKDR